MTLQQITSVVPTQPERRSLSRSARSMGIYVIGGRGTGKSRLMGRKIAPGDFLAGIPLGGTIDNFLDKVIRVLDPLPCVDPGSLLGSDYLCGYEREGERRCSVSP